MLTALHAVPLTCHNVSTRPTHCILSGHVSTSKMYPPSLPTRGVPCQAFHRAAFRFYNAGWPRPPVLPRPPAASRTTATRAWRAWCVRQCFTQVSFVLYDAVQHPILPSAVLPWSFGMVSLDRSFLHVVCSMGVLRHVPNLSPHAPSVRPALWSPMGPYPASGVGLNR